MTAAKEPAYGETKAGMEKVVFPLFVFAVKVETTAYALRGRMPWQAQR